MNISHVKAAYAPGTWLNEGGNSYTAVGPAIITAVTTSIKTAAALFKIIFNYIRVNALGHGVRKVEKPAICADIQMTGLSASSRVPIYLENQDKIDICMWVPGTADSIEYMLVNAKNDDINLSGVCSQRNGLGIFTRATADYSGFADILAMQKLTAAVIEREADSSSTKINATLLNDCGIRTAVGGAYNARSPLTIIRDYFVQCVQAERERSGVEIPEMSYYQYQWAIISGATLSAAEGKKKCYDGGYDWITFEEGYGTEETE